MEAGAVAVAADDVDGAGGIDHGRVPTSRSPRHAGRTIGERRSCSQRARARPVAPNATTRAAAKRAAGRAKNTASHRRAMGWRAQRRGAHTRSLRTHTSDTPARRCNPIEMHEPTHVRSQRHACTDARARTDVRTHSNEHTDPRTTTIDTATHTRVCVRRRRRTAPRAMRTRTGLHAHTQAQAHTDPHTHGLGHTHMQTHTGALTHTHTHSLTGTSSRPRTRTHTCREACIRNTSVQQHRQLHRYILRRRESDMDEGPKWVRCVCTRACVRACESLSARADIDHPCKRANVLGCARARV
jgi:hypothetical protein